MQPERLPLGKIFDVPFLSLDGTSVEMASIIFLFLLVIGISSVQRHRQWVRRGVQGLSFLVFFYVVYSCLGVFGMIRNGLHGATLLGSAYSESFYWLALPAVIIAVTLLHGPVFCGWICPTGTVQDLAGWVRRRIWRVPRKLTRGQVIGLGVLVLGFIVLLIWLGSRKQMLIEDSSLHWAAMLIVLCFLILAGSLDDIPTRKLRLFSLAAIFVTAISHLVVTSPVHFAFTSRDDPASALTTLVILVAALFVLRPWCRYLCPWGAFLGWLHRFSRVRIVRQPDKCLECGACSRSCDVAAIDKGRVRVEHCQFCHSCIDHCPNGGLRIEDVWDRETGRAPLAPTVASEKEQG